jgi:ribosomal-protein-alanine N-acetyltransferase
MIIREMEIEDLEQIMPMEKECFSVPWTENGFFTFLIRQDTLFLVAEEEGEILGYIGILTVLEEGEIANVCVRPSARRRRVGARLLEALLDRMKAKGVTTIHLEVRESNTAAIALYEKYGFIRDGLRRGYYEEPKEDALLMSRQAPGVT